MWNFLVLFAVAAATWRNVPPVSDPNFWSESFKVVAWSRQQVQLQGSQQCACENLRNLSSTACHKSAVRLDIKGIAVKDEICPQVPCEGRIIEAALWETDTLLSFV